MIIVVQSLRDSLRALRNYFAIWGINADSFFLTTSYNKALAKVRQQKGAPGRTVVVSSGGFYTGRHPSGESLAEEVDAIDPTAWFFIYSSMGIEWTKHIDGYLDKLHQESTSQRSEFFSTNFDEVGTLEELWTRMPWLKPVSGRES